MADFDYTPSSSSSASSAISNSNATVGATDESESFFKVERFTQLVCDIEVIAQVLLMERSCMVWVSTSNGGYEFGPLAVSIPTKFDKNAVSMLCSHENI